MSGKTEEDYFDLLGTLGLVLEQVGGKVEVPYSALANLDLTKRELVSTFDVERNVFVFELKALVDN